MLSSFLLLSSSLLRRRKTIVPKIEANKTTTTKITINTIAHNGKDKLLEEMIYIKKEKSFGDFSQKQKDNFVILPIVMKCLM
jgi:hypothetical protein